MEEQQLICQVVKCGQRIAKQGKSANKERKERKLSYY